uniref:Putative licpodalin-4 1 n=1 Tax=Ixodes ricinus TaxID=34613 RepID=V5GLW3_IXORI
MYLQSLLAIFFPLIGSYSQETAETPTPVLLPEEDPQNFPDQYADQVVTMNGEHWVKERTYSVMKPEPTCEYARIFDGDGTKYNLQLGAKLRGKWTNQNQTLVLKTSGNHTKPNVMEFSRTKADGRQDHKLLYSNYKNCSIVRIKRETQGLFCDLLLLGSAANSEPPSPCKEKFEKYCEGQKIQVYTSDCGTPQK